MGFLGASVNVTELLGFRLLTGERRAILNHLWERGRSGTPTHVLTLNPEMVMQAQADPHVRELLAQTDVCVADGVGIEWAARQLGKTGIERYPGVELASDLLDRLAAEQGGVFLLGSAPGVAAEAAWRLEQSRPGLRVTGAVDGYFKPEEEMDLVDTISGSGSDLLLVGMGCPRQEAFIARHRTRLGIPLMIGVGGSLDVFSGRKQRAPEWVMRGKLEWAWRSMQDISRLKRLGVLPRFVVRVLGEAWRGRRKQAA